MLFRTGHPRSSGWDEPAGSPRRPGVSGSLAMCAPGGTCSYVDLYSHPTRVGRFCALVQKGLTAEKDKPSPAVFGTKPWTGFGNRP